MRYIIVFETADELLSAQSGKLEEIIINRNLPAGLYLTYDSKTPDTPIKLIGPRSSDFCIDESITFSVWTKALAEWRKTQSK